MKHAEKYKKGSIKSLIKVNKNTNNINCNHFNYYSNIEKINTIKTITEYTDCLLSLFLLKDKRIAACSEYNTINIYNPINGYHCEEIINRHCQCINSICELEDGTIVLCSNDKSIIIGDYLIYNAHDGPILKVIALPDNRIASCSKDMSIKIWTSSPPYSHTPIKILKDHHNSVTTLLYIKERDIMISGSWDGTLILWNIAIYQCETIIKGEKFLMNNALYQINSDLVIVGGNESFTIININRCVIEIKIKDESIGNVRCFIKLRDIIVCGCESGIMCFYDMNNKKYKITNDNHYDDITDLLVIDNNTFISCSLDNTIKVWNY